MAAIEIKDRFNARLTLQFFADNQRDPLVPGDNWELRFKVKLSGAAVDLTGYKISWRLKHHRSGNELGRSSEVLISGSTNEITIDDQASEGVDSDGNPIGKGVFRLRQLALAAEKTKFEAHIGGNDTNIFLHPPDTNEFTFLQGIFEIPRVIGDRPAFT